MGFSDSQNELQTGGTPCIACLGAHRRHTCALGKSDLMLTAPAEPTAAPVAPAVLSTMRAAGPTADANGGTEKAAAALAAAAATADGAVTEPTRVSHRRSAPPLRLVEDGAGRQASAHTRRKPAATAHDAAAPASAAVERTAVEEPPAGAALAAPQRVAAAAPRVSAGTPLSTGTPRPLDDANTAPVLWVGDSTFVRLTGCDAWGALQMGDLRSEIKSVNGEKPPELLRRLDKLADKHPHPRALVLCTVSGK